MLSSWYILRPDVCEDTTAKLTEYIAVRPRSVLAVATLSPAPKTNPFVFVLFIYSVIYLLIYFDKGLCLQRAIKHKGKGKRRFV